MQQTPRLGRGSYGRESLRLLVADERLGPSEGVDQLINWLHVFMILLFVGWGVFFIYCLIQFRRGANPLASYELVKGKTAKYVEIAVVIIEAILLVGISMPVWSEFKTEAGPDAGA